MRFIPRGIKQEFVLTLMVLLSFTTLTHVSRAQEDQYARWENGVSESWWFAEKPNLPQEIAAAQSRWKLIEIENQTASANEWAGDYFIGSETHGSYLRWSPQNGFVLMNVDKCQAMVMSLDYGKVIVSPTLIQLSPEVIQRSTGSHMHSHARLTPTTLVPVKWRRTHYLIPEKEMADFADYVAGLGKHNGWRGDYIEGTEFFSKLNDKEEDSDEDSPIVPSAYEHLIKKPIAARITAVRSGYRKIDAENGWWDEFIIPVTINVGSTHGVKPKMSFRIPGSQGFGAMEEKVEVQRAGMRTSQGVIVRTVRKSPCVKIDKADDCENSKYRAVKIGWSVTTRPL